MRLDQLIAQLQLHLANGPEITVEARDVLGAVQSSIRVRVIHSGQSLLIEGLDNSPAPARCNACGMDDPEHMPYCSKREKEAENNGETSDSETSSETPEPASS